MWRADVSVSRFWSLSCPTERNETTIHPTTEQQQQQQTCKYKINNPGDAWPRPLLILANQISQSWDVNKLWEELGARGQRSGRRRRSLCHHVLLPLVESDLAERDGAHHHVDGGGNEAVDADLVVETVDVLRRTFTVEKKRERRRIYLLFVICQTASRPWRVAASEAWVEPTEQLLAPDSLVTDVVLSEWDVLDQHGWFGAEEDSQHRLQESKTGGQHEAQGPVRATATNQTLSLSLNVFYSLLQLRTFSDNKSRKWSAEYFNWQTWDLRTEQISLLVFFPPQTKKDFWGHFPLFTESLQKTADITEWKWKNWPPVVRHHMRV